MRISSRLQPLSLSRQRPQSLEPVADPTSASPLLLSDPPYQHFSDLRTTYDPAHNAVEKFRRGGDRPPMQEPCCADPSDISPTVEGCSECVQECEDGACDSLLTEQCTEQCVVVPCNDAHHELPPCDASSVPGSCDIMCVDDTDCSVLENFVSCRPRRPV